jgi:uncharacterized membrane protein YhaH (DUF805 family)
MATFAPFSGRVGRRDLILGVLLTNLAPQLILNGVIAGYGDPNRIPPAAGLVLLVLGLVFPAFLFSLVIRRLHDFIVSPKAYRWLLTVIVVVAAITGTGNALSVVLAPGLDVGAVGIAAILVGVLERALLAVGLIFSLFFVLQKGTAAPNRYGDAPPKHFELYHFLGLR